MQEKEIEKLIKKSQRQDSKAFISLMQYYAKDMYKTAIAILMNDEDVADAIQDTILTCWEKLNTLRESRYFKTWMTRILINKCYAIKKQNKHIVLLDEYEEVSVENSLNENLYEILSVLDEKYRIPMMLFYGQGYKTEEIAQMLHSSKSTIQTRLARGREKLATYFKGEKVFYESI